MFWIEAIGVYCILLVIFIFTREELSYLIIFTISYGYAFTLGMMYFFTLNTWMYAIFNYLLCVIFALSYLAQNIIKDDELYLPLIIPIVTVWINVTLWEIQNGYHLLGLYFPFTIIMSIVYIPHLRQPLPNEYNYYQNIYTGLFLLGCYIAIRG